MKKPLIVIGVDVGMKRFAMCSELHGESFPFLDYVSFYNVVYQAIEQIHPDLIVCGKPQGLNQNVKFAQGKLVGILNLLGQKMGVAVPGHGNKSKVEIQKLTKITDPDLSDAWVFRKAGEQMEI
jgi:hypothetical protein